MQSIRLNNNSSSTKKNTATITSQKSLFSCNVYQTNHHVPPVTRSSFAGTNTNNNAASTSREKFQPGPASLSNFNHDNSGSKSPEVIFINRNIVPTAPPLERLVPRNNKLVRDVEGDSGTNQGTQTSKTILELAQLEYGQMSPDSLNQSPREYEKGDGALSEEGKCSDDQYSNYTLEGSCTEQDPNLMSPRRPQSFGKQLHVSRCMEHFSPPPPNSYESLAYNCSRIAHNNVNADRTLTKRFLDKARRRSARSQNLTSTPSEWKNHCSEPAENVCGGGPVNYFRSKSLINNNFSHPNYISEPVYSNKVITNNVQIGPPKSPTKPNTKRNKTFLDLPDNSYILNYSSSQFCLETKTFMSPTTSTRLKSNMQDIQSIIHLIPPTRRGRSTSPRMRSPKKPTEVRKIPYIDQSRSNLGSETTLTNQETATPSNRDVVVNKKEQVCNTIANSKTSKMVRSQVMNRVRCNKTEENLTKVHDFAVNIKASCETFTTNADTISSIDGTISSAITKFKNVDWNIALKGLAEIVELCRLVDTDVIYHHMSDIYQRLIELLKSPRSYVCRTACQATGHLFEYVKDTRRPEFDDIVDILLFKTADANKFIRKDANMALDCMVTHISSFHAIRVLCAKGPSHKNALVRSATVRLLVCVVVISGAENIFNANNSEYTRKRIFFNLIKFLEDKNMETRCYFCTKFHINRINGAAANVEAYRPEYIQEMTDEPRFGERLYRVLSKDPRFDSCLRKYLDKEQIAKMKRMLKLIKK